MIPKNGTAMKTQIASAAVVESVPVGGSQKGNTTQRFERAMKMNSVARKPRYFSDRDRVVSAFLCVGRFFFSGLLTEFLPVCARLRWVMRGRPDLSIIAPDRGVARMPGTGPLRRSSAPVRIKAIVDKSRIGAGALRSPRFVFLTLFEIVFIFKDFKPPASGIVPQIGWQTGPPSLSRLSAAFATF